MQVMKALTARAGDKDLLIPLVIDEVPAGLLANMGLTDVTERFNGSVGTLKRAVEKGEIKLPRDGVYICSKRLSKQRGSNVYFLVKQSQHQSHQKTLSTLTSIGSDRVNLILCSQNMQHLP